jgi:PAS domain S-box-containing protein
MAMQVDHPAEEAERLQRCINDLVSVLALPATSAGGDLSQIGRSLLDVLLPMLGAEFVYLRLADPDSRPTHEMVAFAPSFGAAREAPEVGAALARSLGADATKWPPSAPMRFGETGLAIAAAQLGAQGDLGVIVAGSQRSDFPGQTDGLVLGVAANQTAVALYEIHHLAAQKPALHEGEADARQIVGNIPGIVLFFMTPDGRHDVVSPQLTRYFGKSVEELQNWMTGDTVHPEDRPHAVEVFTRAMVSGEPYMFEARFRRSDGVYQWFQCRGLPRRDETGRIIRWSCVGIDIDDRRRAEAALRESEFESRLIVNSIPAGVTVFTPDGKVELINNQILNYLGRTQDDLARQGILESIHPDDRSRFIEARKHSLATGDSYDFECRLRRFDDAYRWFQVRGHPLRNESGRIVRWYGVHIDIDERRSAEDALRQSEARLVAAERELQRAMDNIPARVGTYSADGSHEFVNSWVRRLSGLSSVEDWRIAIHPDDIDLLDNKWRACVSSGQPFEMEYRSLADGAYRWHVSRRVPARDEAGKVVRWYAVNYDIEDRKRAEGALRKSEARLAAAERDLQLMIDTIPVFVAAYAPDGTRNFANRTWQDYMGLTLGEATGASAKAFPHFHPDDAERNDRAWRAALANGESLSIEVRVRRADGQYRWHTSRRVPLRDENGDIVRWYSVGIDIHDQKVAEDARRESEARLAETEQELRLTLDSIPTMTWRAAQNGYVLSVNKRWFDYTGCTPEQVRNGRWQSFVHPNDLAGLLASGRRNIPAGRSADAEARLRRHDGEYRWFLFRVEPAHDASGKIAAWYGIITDIEDRKRAEQALRQSETRLAEAEREVRATLDSIPTITWRADPNGYVQSLNRRWFEYTGTTPEKMRGARWKACVHPVDLEQLVNIGREYVASGVPIDGEARLRRHDGEYRWFLFRPAPARDEAGNIVGWYGSIIDIEDRKRAEEKVTEAERELRRTIDGIPAIVTGYCADGSLLFMNERAVEFVGHTRVGDIRTTVHPDDVDRAESKWRACIANGEPFELEMRTLRFDGVYRWHRRLRVPIRDQAGDVVRWYGVGYDIEDRKRAEEAVVASERKFKLITDTILALAWSARLDGSVDFFNQHYIDYVGLPSEQLHDWGWTAAVHPDDLTGLAEMWRAIMASGKAGEAEARLRRHDGQYRWFLLRANPLRDEAGNIVKWYGVNTDIEDRKRAEQAIAASERNLKLTIDTIPALAWSSSPDGSAEFVNKHYQDFAGLSLEQLQGLGWTTAVHPDDQSGLTVAWKSMLASGQGGEIEARLRRHDGEYRRLLFRTNPLRDENGNIVKWYGINTDIEDRKRAEEQLRRSEAFLAEGQRISSTGTYAWSGDLTETMFLSEEFYRIFEYEQGTALTFAQLIERFHPEDRPILADKIERIAAGHENPEWQIRLRIPDGRIKHLRVIGRVIRHQDGRLERIGAVQDVTQRRLAEESRDKVRTELAHVTRVMSLGALTASIAHEVNQPLAGIITNASTCLRMLAADPPNIDGARETARRTIRDGNRAADVIARLRALFSRKDAPKETVDLKMATREVLSLLFGDLLRNRIILRAELDSDHPLLVAGDRVQLQQVILNLIRNAMDAMREVNDRPRHLLVIADADEEGRARLVVKDAGVGIDPQGAERLFDPFYTTKGDGMGIGLSVSRSIIESHGGVLQAAPNDNHGATFSFSIPRQGPGAVDAGTVSAAFDVSNDERARRC